MNTRTILTLAVLTLSCLFGLGTSAEKERPSRQAWEYYSTDSANDLNKLGAEGWELVGVYGRIGSPGGTTDPIYFLKRAK